MKMQDIRNELDAMILRLQKLRDETFRRKPVTRAPTTSVKMTPEIKKQILDLRKEYPDMSNQAIATHVGVNIGRVSETLRGKRT